MAKFCHEMHYILPISVICVAHSALWPLLFHDKLERFHAFYFDTDCNNKYGNHTGDDTDI